MIYEAKSVMHRQNKLWGTKLGNQLAPLTDLHKHLHCDDSGRLSHTSQHLENSPWHLQVLLLTYAENQVSV